MTDPVAEPAPHDEAVAPAVTELGPSSAADTVVAPPANGEHREEAPPAPPDPEPEPARPSTALSLEERVRRLEDALAALHVLPPPTPPPGQKTHVIPGSAAQFLGPLTKVAGLDPAPAAAPAPAVGEAAAGPPPLPPRPVRWLLVEILAEMRAVLRMFLDPRYRLGWRTKLLLPLLILGMVVSWWMISALPVVGWAIDRFLFFFLSYLLFKVLTREATHYRATSPDLPESLRL